MIDDKPLSDITVEEHNLMLEEWRLEYYIRWNSPHYRKKIVDAFTITEDSDWEDKKLITAFFSNYKWVKYNDGTEPGITLITQSPLLSQFTEVGENRETK